MSAAIITLPVSQVEPTTEVPASPWWRVEEAARYAKLHPQAIYRACRERKLQHVRVGGRRAILVKREWVDAYLESQMVLVPPTRNRAA